jgi:hypothetical protein
VYQRLLDCSKYDIIDDVVVDRVMYAQKSFYSCVYAFSSLEYSLIFKQERRRTIKI